MLELKTSESLDTVISHAETYIGKVKFTYHENVPNQEPIDIVVVSPTPRFNFYTILTAGMSDFAMEPPNTYKDKIYSELLICLPPDWKMSEFDWLEEKWFWPISLLRFLASYPEEYETWLWRNHTIESLTREPYAKNVEMKNSILWKQKKFRKEASKMKSEKRTVYFHSVIPLHDNEVKFKIDKGAQALFERLETQNVNELLHLKRDSAVGDYEGKVSHKVLGGF